MNIRCVWEHNGDDTLLHAVDLPGAFARGASLEIALQKMDREAVSYLRWLGKLPPDCLVSEIVEDSPSQLEICDADSDVLFKNEANPLTMDEYIAFRTTALRSAEDFYALYMSIPDKKASCLPRRKTFYGPVPRTAEEMYIHTKNVNAYYFGEIGVCASNDGTIFSSREKGFEKLESMPGFLSNTVYSGSYGEAWSLRKVLRRFIWHDRIHARAMYRMAQKTFGHGSVPDIFLFDAP